MQRTFLNSRTVSLAPCSRRVTMQQQQQQKRSSISVAAASSSSSSADAASPSSSASASSSSSSTTPTRRDALALGAAAALSLGSSLVVPTPAALAEEGEYTILYGTASPPTSYGGYGGNAQETAKYSFEYPSNWKAEVIGKQQKGMVGIDSKVTNPRSKLQSAYVITFGRAGEDNKKFKLGDVERTLEGFAGADYNLQDALTAATDKKAQKRDGSDQEFYDYEVVGPDFTYLAAVTLNNGKVFALFVSSPSKSFKNDERALRHIVESFKTI